MRLTQTRNKLRLENYIKALKHVNKQRNKIKSKKSEEPKIEPLPQYKNSLELDFDHSPQSIQLKIIQKCVSKLITQRLRPEKVPIK